ncbi:MAG: 2-C-methyl-D-erythritol 4-phosphate cytidylyltransferase [Bacteroidales bacterium]|nr:2-C-methyl-D-erythritol 4-phosphate cytidylyltransferase [Bacteroidales bacterium]
MIVTAGGSGTRMGGPLPKQFLALGGEAILQRTISLFTHAIPGIRVITVLPREHISWWEEYCQTHPFPQPQRIVKGGFTRFHSVQNALKAVPDGAIVAVHDAVRPLITPGLIQKLFAAMESERAVIPVTPSVDTLKILDRVEGKLTEAPEALDRSRIWCAQTPQIFRSEDLKAAYTQAYSTLFTDDASVAAAYGIPLTFVEGERLNLKITTPEDLRLAQAIANLSS